MYGRYILPVIEKKLLRVRMQARKLWSEQFGEGLSNAIDRAYAYGRMGVEGRNICDDPDCKDCHPDEPEEKIH